MGRDDIQSQVPDLHEGANAPDREFERIIAQFEYDWHHGRARDWRAYLSEDPTVRQMLEKELPAIENEFRGGGTATSDRSIETTSHTQLERAGHPGDRTTAGRVTASHPRAHRSSAVSHTAASTLADAAKPALIGSPFSMEFEFSEPTQTFAGGLGDVWVVDEPALGRRIVIKQLQRRWANHRRAEQAFSREVRITSMLEHPCIAPVHAIGRTIDGRPCYSMRYVRGETLLEAITSAHQQANPDTDALRRLIDPFLAICQTVAYVHSQRIIHRDLKPGNIVIGPYGKTVLLDWGLAKQLDDDSPEFRDNATPLSVESNPMISQTLGTEMGDVVGTPAYMSPEQALGDTGAIGPCSDVFGLGGILYHVLKGQPPLKCHTCEETMARARCAKIDFSLPTSAPPWMRGLMAVCQKAMAPRPKDRYASAEALAHDVEAWMQGEDSSVARQPWGQRAMRFLARRKTMAFLSTFMALAALVAIVVGVVRVQEERNERILETHKSQANVRAAGKISQYLANVFRSAEPMGFEQSSGLGTEVDAKTALKRIVDRGYGLIDSDLRKNPENIHELLLSLGYSYRGLGIYDRSNELLREALQIREQLYGPDDLRSLEARYHIARLDNDQGNYDAAESAYRDLIDRIRSADREMQLLKADAKFHLAWLLFYQPLRREGPLYDMERVRESKRLFDEVIQVRELLLPENDRTIGLAYAGYSAACLSHQEMNPESIFAATHAMKIFQANGEENELGSFMLDYQNAERLRLQGRFEETENLLVKMKGQLTRSLGRSHPAFVLHLWNMAGLYRKMDELQKAESVITEIRSIARDLPTIRSSPNHLNAMRQYIEALVEARPHDALPVLRETLQWAKERPQQNEQLIQQWNALAETLENTHPSSTSP